MRPSSNGPADKGRPKEALLGVADGELGIGRKEEGGVLVRLEIVVNVGHPHLLVATQERTEAVTRRDTLMQQEGSRIEREHSRALVVGDAATEEIALTLAHGKGVARPAGAGRDHVHVTDRGELGPPSRRRYRPSRG